MEVNFPSAGKEVISILSYMIFSIIMIHSIFSMYWHRVYIDELTKLPNRRALDEKLNALNGNYTIGMIDIDHFKKFNDTFGHDAGDDVLRAVASLIKDMPKASVYRYGGEEFTAIFEKLDSEQSFIHADMIREKVHKKEFYIRQSIERNKSDRGKVEKSDKTKVQISISMGLSTVTDKTAEDTIKEADQALYSAKEAGRNVVKIFTKK